MSFWDDQALVQTSSSDTELLQAIARISTYSSEARYVWRGQPDLSWKLNPGLMRRLDLHSRANGQVTESQLRGHERQLLSNARAAGYGRTVGDIELLAILQHHGAATRLLDVSSDPMVAMWFAVENQDLLTKDGALFAINISNAIIVSGDENRKLTEILDSIPKKSIAFYEPPGADERIKVQRGRFVFSKLTGDEPPELSLPIDIKDWSTDRRIKFFDGPRGSGRPVPPSILVLKIPRRIKQRLLSLLENSYGYTAETMFPDLSGFAAANGWQRAMRRDRRPVVELTPSFLPVIVPLKKGAYLKTSFKNLPKMDMLRVAKRELAISAVRIDTWRKDPASAPRYWAAYHADEVVGVFEIDKNSWRASSGNRYICDLDLTDDPDALAVVGCSFVYEERLIPISGRAVFARHTPPGDI